MNTIILSAIFGVMMMLSGIFIKNKAAFKYVAAVALLVLLIFNIAESNGFSIFNINPRNLLHFTKFGLLFNSICIGATLIYFLLSGRDFEAGGK